MPKVSIIIPVYNAEKYIETTVQSVLDQTFSSWELLLIDDCSEDKTPIICNKLEQSDNRIVYIRQEENCGPSKARNLGLDLAKGEFIAFVDSDDMLEPAFLNKMLTTATENKSDIVWCNYKEIAAGNVIYKKHNLPSGYPIPYETYIQMFFNNQEGLGCLWNKLYRRDFIEQNKIRMNLDRVHGEDWEFNMTCFKCHPLLMAIEDSLYNYIRQNDASVISSYRASDYNTFVKSSQMLDELALSEGIKCDIVAMKSNFIYLVIQLLVLLSYSNIEDKYSQFKSIVDDDFFRKALRIVRFSAMAYLPVRYKLYFILIKFRLIKIAYLAMR